MGTYLLPGVLAVMGRRHLALRVRISIEDSERVLGSLLSGQADVGQGFGRARG